MTTEVTTGTPCSTSCLLPNTLIYLADNRTKLLNQIQVGDKVLGFNISSKMFVNNTVLSIEHANFTNFYTIISTNGFEINITGNHYVLTRLGYKRAEHLKRGETVFTYTQNGVVETKIKEIIINWQNVTASTLITDGTDNFFANNLLVYED